MAVGIVISIYRNKVPNINFKSQYDKQPSGMLQNSPQLIIPITIIAIIVFIEMPNINYKSQYVKPV